MVKKRKPPSKSETEKFGLAAARNLEEIAEDAPRGTRAGGRNVLLPLNQYEHGVISSAAKKDNRSVSSFMRLAALTTAKLILDEESQSKGSE